jgi:hypothetical protein
MAFVVIGLAAEEFTEEELEIVRQILVETEAEVIAGSQPTFSSENAAALNGTQVLPAVGASLDDDSLRKGVVAAAVTYEGAEFPFLVFLMAVPEEMSADFASALFNPLGEAFDISSVIKEVSASEVEELTVDLRLPEDEGGQLLVLLNYNKSTFKFRIPESAPEQQ